ncbi:MAG: hypothetical protein ACREDE_05400, partial [Thermoplasmata archaeon]
METLPGAWKRPSGRVEGPEAQEPSRGISERPRVPYGALAIEAPPWTPLCANYEVVQLGRGTRQQHLEKGVRSAE